MARAMLLTISDFPTGWASSPGVPLKDPDKCSNKATLPHRTASIDSDDFRSSASASLSESIVIFDSVDAASAVLTNAPQSIDCAVQRINNGELNTNELALGNATVGPESFPSLGDQSLAFRATETATSKSANVRADVFEDVLSIRKGRIVVGIEAQDVLSPFDSVMLQEIAMRAVARIADPSAAHVPATASVTAPQAIVAPATLGPSATLAGNAMPLVPDGDPGKVVVVSVGTFNSDAFGTTVPVIIRNNSPSAITHVELAAGAKDSAGRIIGSGNSQDFHPGTLAPGQAALGYVYFQTKLGPSTSFDFSFETSEPSTSSFAIVDLDVTQANATGGHITGGASNATSKVVQGPFTVGAFCFDSNGQLTGEHGTGADGPNNLSTSGSVTFDVNLFGVDCSEFLVGVSGYYK